MIISASLRPADGLAHYHPTFLFELVYDLAIKPQEQPKDDFTLQYG